MSEYIKKFNSDVIAPPNFNFICVLTLSLVKMTGSDVTEGLINEGGIKQLPSFIRENVLL